MIIMPVPKDIRNVKAKFIGPFTRRQAYAVIPAAVIGYLIQKILSSFQCPPDLSVVIIFLVVTPVIMCGFIDVCGMPLWDFARNVAIRRIFAPKTRPYVTENTFDKLAVQNKITYEYFDGDDKEYTEKEMKKKRKQNKKRLERYLKEHPDMNAIQ